MADDIISGSRYSDRVYLGSGSQAFEGGSGNDRIISYGDGGEPDPAQTEGAEGRVHDPVPEGAADDLLIGGAGGDTFEFRALLNAKESTIAEHTNSDGSVNWRAVAGENDNVHDHWVEGFGNDTIADYSKAEGDKIVIRGHTVEIAEITYGEDDGGSYSLIRVISQQGNGGAGGANTETGAHDEDSLGTIKVYGDKVTLDDVTVQAAGVFDGVDQLQRADEAYGDHDAGAVQEVFSNSDGQSYTGNLANQTDVVRTGLGSQEVDAGGGSDYLFSYSDGGEPDPAQTDGADGRVNDPVADGAADDVFTGGQGRDTFFFNLLLNAKEEILEKHTNSNGQINWRGVAGENNNVHDHWVESIGNDVITDYSNQDGDKIVIRGHTVEIAEIAYGEDENGDYSLIQLRSQQGDNGGAHDEDLLGTIKVYGDTVTEDDIQLQTAGVFDGVDKLDAISEGEAVSPAANEVPEPSEIQWGLDNPQDIDVTFTGTDHWDTIKAGSGSQTVDGGNGGDRIISYGDAGEPDPAQTEGADGRVNPALPEGAADDVFTGGAGRDTFEFRALINARREVIEAHTGSNGYVNWRGVAGENDNVHDHWVEGFGNDTITDYSKAEGDKIVIRGHTVEVSEVTYGADDGGTYSLIHVISQQGDGGAGGANTATGAHDEDSLGTIKVYGDHVTLEDITVQRANVFDGVDQLQQADRLLDLNGGVQSFFSSTDGEEIVTAPDDIETTDYVTATMGAQVIRTGAGRDEIRLTSDGGEPDPAQSGGTGRINPAVPQGQANDIVSGGQGRDTFLFNLQINATAAVIATHTRSDGSVDWRRVAGENGALHDHWVEGIGNDVITDYSNQDGDKIVIRGHTVEIAEITYGEDGDGDYSLIQLRSQQGDNGGAHDEDLLGSIRVYGDRVTADDISVQSRVFDGIDAYADQSASALVGNLVYGDNDANRLTGTAGSDIAHGKNGADVIQGGAGNDFLFGDGHNDIVFGGEGNDWVEGGWGNDMLFGNEGDDTLVADSGYDSMFGGGGSDLFVFENGMRGATIYDWEDGSDLLDFSRNGSVNGMDDLSIDALGGNFYGLSYTNGDGRLVEIHVIGGSDFTLEQSDFVF